MHDHGRGLQFRERRLCDVAPLPVDDKHLCFGVFEDKGDRRGIEARVQRIEHRASHRHAKVGLEHGRCVRAEDGDDFALADAAAL